MTHDCVRNEISYKLGINIVGVTLEKVAQKWGKTGISVADFRSEFSFSQLVLPIYHSYDVETMRGKFC